MRQSKTVFESNLVLQSQSLHSKASPGYFVGLDASLTSFGVYCLPADVAEPYSWIVQSTAKDGSDTLRVQTIAADIIEALGGISIVNATFEDYGPINRTSGKIAQRAEMCGIIKYHLLTVRRVPVITVPPNSLKGFATGRGNASKEEMLAEAAKHGVFPDTNDEADAYFAARVGRAVHTGGRIGVSFERTNP